MPINPSQLLFLAPSGGTREAGTGRGSSQPQNEKRKYGILKPDLLRRGTLTSPQNPRKKGKTLAQKSRMTSFSGITVPERGYLRERKLRWSLPGPYNFGIERTFIFLLQEEGWEGGGRFSPRE